MYMYLRSMRNNGYMNSVMFSNNNQCNKLFQIRKFGIEITPDGRKDDKEF